VADAGSFGNLAVVLVGWLGCKPPIPSEPYTEFPDQGEKAREMALNDCQEAYHSA